MKLEGKVTKVETMGAGVRVTTDCSSVIRNAGGVVLRIINREATIDIAEKDAAAYYVGRKVRVTIAPVAE